MEISPVAFQRLTELVNMRLSRAHGRFEGKRWTVIELGSQLNATNDVDKIYGLMGASGAEILPVIGETQEEAWSRWWAEAVRVGFFRWAMLTLPSTDAHRPAPSKGAPRLNCIMPSFSTLQRASSTARLVNVKPYDNVKVENGTVSAVGRRLGTCAI